MKTTLPILFSSHLCYSLIVCGRTDLTAAWIIITVVIIITKWSFFFFWICFPFPLTLKWFWVGPLGGRAPVATSLDPLVAPVKCSGVFSQEPGQGRTLSLYKITVTVILIKKRLRLQLHLVYKIVKNWQNGIHNLSEPTVIEKKRFLIYCHIWQRKVGNPCIWGAEIVGINFLLIE